MGADRGPDRSWLTDNRPETLRRQVHEALTDLRVEASELTYLRLGGDGQAALSDVPLEDSLGALVDLRDQGLIRRIGLSGAGPGQLRRARAMTPIAAVENRYNLLDRSGVEVLADCEAHGIAFVPYWPLAFGQLAKHEELDPRGSMALRTRRFRSITSGPSWRGSASRLARPTPCSPVIVPPWSTADRRC